MRLGDFICVQDYDAIWGEPKRAREPSLSERVGLWLIVIVVGVALGFFSGCDYQAAQATHEIRTIAIEKSEALPPQAYFFDNPLGQQTWVEQSGNDGEGKQMKPIRRYTFAADLTRRDK